MVAFPAVTAAETALAAAEAAAEGAAAALNAERTPLHSKDVTKSFTDAAQATPRRPAIGATGPP